MANKSKTKCPLLGGSYLIDSLPEVILFGEVYKLALLYVCFAMSRKSRSNTCSVSVHLLIEFGHSVIVG